MTSSDPELVVVRAIDEGRWSVYGPRPRSYAEPFRDALEASGAFDRVEIHPAAEVCAICGWRIEQGHDLDVHRDWDRA